MPEVGAAGNDRNLRLHRRRKAIQLGDHAMGQRDHMVRTLQQAALDALVAAIGQAIRQPCQLPQAAIHALVHPQPAHVEDHLDPEQALQRATHLGGLVASAVHDIKAVTAL